MLTCSEPHGDDAPWYYEANEDMGRYLSWRGQKCRSCGTMIRSGDECLKFLRWRTPRSDVEESIHGDEVRLAPWYLCEECAGLYWSLSELGFCGLLGQNLRELCKEYAELRKEHAERSVR